MYDDVRNALAKLKKDFVSVSDKMSFWADGAPQVSFGYMEVELTGTLFLINAAALLDEGLGEYIDVNFPGAVPHTLHLKTLFLDRRGRLTNTIDLRALKDKRNEFAHELDRYGNWDDARWAIGVLEKTFTDLGML